VSKQNTFVDNLKVSELNRIWTANQSRQANTWKDLRPEWPDQRIELFGPGTNSGTFDYFVEAIITPFDGSTSKGRSDYTPSEDDHVLVQGVAGTSRGLAYFGLAYAEESADRLRVVPIIQDTKDGGKTFIAGAAPIAPTPANVESGAYAPLSRPLFMYTSGAPQGPLKEWFTLGLSDAGQEIVSEVGYVKLPEAKRAEILARLG
jgi:phosphate transport system substrate-binding protein